MGAYVEHAFKHGFLLDEGGLRKIHDILATRLTKFDQTPPIQYKVFRGDSYSYETESMETVTQEDNEDWRKVTRLDITAETPDVFDLRLSFSHVGCRLTISGDDRDDVFLIFSDLRDYIQNEVAKAPKVSPRLASNIPMIALMLAAMAFLVDMHMSQPSVKEYEAVLRSSDVMDKLNFLIEYRENRTPESVVWLMGVVVVISVLSALEVFEKIARALFPSNEFLFGKRKETYIKRKSLNNKLVWVVGVGFVVGVVATLTGWYMTSK